MEQRDGENGDDDGIVAEDVTQLVEHIELTGQHRLYEAHAWERAVPAADLDDAPILIDEIPDDPELESMGVDEDLELFTETHADLNQLLPPGERRANQAAAISAERARWQQRVDALQRSLAERDQLLSERNRLIEELSARLATRTLEREGLAEELRDETAARLAEAAQPAADETPPQSATPAATPATDIDYTAELPAPELPRELPAAAPQLAPRLRRYLIGIDLVGCVHELSSHRINIGRTRDNDLRIVDPTVSRLHAMLTVRNGEAMVVDANSRNGIFVNGIQVRYAKLEDGDMLTFGTVRFRYRVGSDIAGGAFGSA